MKRVAVVLVVAGLVQASFAFGLEKFDRVLVMTGQGMNSPLMVGVVDGLVKAGKKPDLIIAGCGAAYSGAVVNAIPDKEKRDAYLTSKEYYNLLKSVTVNESEATYFKMLARLTSTTQRNFDGLTLSPQRKIPNVYHTPLINVPSDLGKDTALDEKFSIGTEENPKIRLIIMCARVNFSKETASEDHDRDEWQDDNGKKLYSIEYFTDPDTARWLEGLETPIAGLRDKDVPFSKKTLVTTTQSVIAAARGSAADPYLISPSCKDGVCLVSGAADHYPVELAEKLGKKIYMTYAGRFSSPERIFYADIFGFDIYERQDHGVESDIVDHWIDLSDSGDKLGETNTLHLKIDINPLASSPVKMRIPSAYGDDFKSRVKFQLELGKARGEEATETDRGSLEHIRKKFTPQD